jgi:uncharacterized protein (DUF697 family)
MSVLFWKQVSNAVAGLSPDTVVQESLAPYTIALVGSTDEVSAMEDWLVPTNLNVAEQAQARRHLYPMAQPLTDQQRNVLPQMNIRIAGASAVPHNAVAPAVTHDYFLFNPEDLEMLAAQIVMAHPDLHLALARGFPALRAPVINRIVQRTAKENAAFAILSALPNVIPSPIELPWAIGEFASDTIVITANQIRMALAIAAACGTPVGFGEQRGQVMSIVGSAFGLRALAREIAGKIPAGGGMVTKGLIAFAGTYTLGMGLSHWNRNGRKLTWNEKRLTYRHALEAGRDMVEDMTHRALPH